MNDSADRDLRTRFDALRRTDASEAPGFRELIGREVRRPAPTAILSPRRLLRAAIALAAAIVFAAGVARVSRRRAPSQVPLSAWTSPTASLLHTPGIGLSSTSAVLTSALDLSDAGTAHGLAYLHNNGVNP